MKTTTWSVTLGQNLILNADIMHKTIRIFFFYQNVFIMMYSIFVTLMLIFIVLLWETKVVQSDFA